ncbi:2-hydroxyacid dehydrogenase [Nitrospirillum viridazoti]|uniref:Glyoxylate/hydroxypyruvate reductase A n=1 Tax=Nitrospirillum amazonense TaxID=28077 RepID=A0A560HVH6_9PROT|nr:glyoxylate/hydroxypyruvate reductase A [Nitrospirillum amazonense]TWB50617.1 glyoxylate/hydroxypyruvate reductase A [Nitrospirillum amazonense]
MSVLYKSETDRGRAWQSLFADYAPDIGFHLWPEMGDPAAIRYLAAWAPTADIFAALPNLEVLFSIGAGVDQLDLSQVPQSVAVVRMVEAGLTEGMVEYAVFATLALHRRVIDYISDQRQGRWQPARLVPPAKRRVGVMGLGVLGQAVLARLSAFGFPLLGWSRTPHAIAGVDCYAGREQLPDFLAQCDVLICLLPLTPGTRGILCRETFDLLPEGAGLINAGRGGHLIESDLLDALDGGRLAGAVLDVLNSEPPPATHPFWRHPKILLTPHIASMTTADTGGQALLDNIRRHQAGIPMQGLIRRDLGY